MSFFVIVVKAILILTKILISSDDDIFLFLILHTDLPWSLWLSL